MEPQREMTNTTRSRTTAAAAMIMGLRFLDAGPDGLLGGGAGVLRWAGIRADAGRLGLLAATCIPGEIGMVLEVALRAPCWGLGSTTGEETCG